MRRPWVTRLLWQHTLEADERDDPVAPTRGYVARLTQELAGLGGDVFFGKVDLHMQVFRELFWNWVSLGTSDTQHGLGTSVMCGLGTSAVFPPPSNSCRCSPYQYGLVF